MIAVITLLILGVLLFIRAVITKPRVGRIFGVIESIYILSLGCVLYFFGWETKVVLPCVIVGALLFFVLKKLRFRKLRSLGSSLEAEKERRTLQQELAFSVFLIVFGAAGLVATDQDAFMLTLVFAGVLTLIRVAWEYWNLRSITRKERQAI